MTPVRVSRVVDDDCVSVLLSIDPTSTMFSLTAKELLLTLSSREATEVGFSLIDAAEATR
jgi:hypothetical protein